MYLTYSFLYSLAFLLMLPMFLIRRAKYASGFRERLGNCPEFVHDGRPVIWLHCVSVGEANAARPLVDSIVRDFPSHRIVVSTTTRTGQELAKKIFAGKADAVFYFPFDWKFSVRRALAHFKPSAVLLMETEIWPRFIHEAKKTGAKVAIVNGRLSQKSFDRYSTLRSFVATILHDVDLALMQGEADADRLVRLGLDPGRVKVTGNIKFDQLPGPSDAALTEYFRTRFATSQDRPLILAASTHEPEEKYLVRALEDLLGSSCRLMLVPRHPERFDSVEEMLKDGPYSYVRRSSNESDGDKHADIILLDSIGELRSAYPLADIVFVGGSLIPHGGQSVIEPAAAAKPILTGPHTHNFAAVVDELERGDGIIVVRGIDDARTALSELVQAAGRREQLGSNALAVIRANSGSTAKTISFLKQLVAVS